MTTESKQNIPLNRLIIYVLLGAGIIAFALIGRDSTQSDIVELDSAEVVEAQPEILRGSVQTAELDSGVISLAHDIELASEEIDVGDEEVIEADSNGVDEDVAVADPENQSFFGQRRQIRAERRRSGEFDIGDDDSGVDNSSVNDPGASDLSTDDSSVNNSDGGVLIASVSDSGNSDTATASTSESGTDDTDPAAGETETTDTNKTEGDTDSSQESEDDDADIRELAGRWSGAMESSASVNENGEPCAGADMSVSLFYYNLTAQYEMVGTVRPREGFLNRSRGFYFALDGRVTSGGELSANNEPLHQSWEEPNYRADYSGIVVDTQGNGTWADNFGCSGTWFLVKT